jgi:2-alkenal reductase
MKKNLRLVVVVSTLVLASLACQMFAPAPAAIPTPTVAAVQAPVVPIANINPAQDGLVALYDNVIPGVVSIQVLTDQGGALGSGFVYDGEGHIVTNFHVVDGATKVEVTFQTGYKATGTVLGTDIDSDLAVIQTDAPATELHPLVMGDSDLLKVGQSVIAIGNPFGLNGTMTTGIVSALGRTLPSNRNAPGGGSFGAGGIIQTDAAINPGNSGGPLFNLNGEVIGINRAIRTDASNASGEPVNSGIGFAISINIVKRVVPYLIRDGKYDYPFLGVTSLDLADMSIDEIKLLGFDRFTGIYITSVVKSGPADQAGLQAGTEKTTVDGLLSGGDLLIAIDGHALETYADLIGFLFSDKSPGDQAVLTIIRDGQPIEVTVTLGKRP